MKIFRSSLVGILALIVLFSFSVAEAQGEATPTPLVRPGIETQYPRTPPPATATQTLIPVYSPCCRPSIYGTSQSQITPQPQATPVTVIGQQPRKATRWNNIGRRIFYFFFKRHYR